MVSEESDFNRVCQSGAGTARYDSASWSSRGSNSVGELESNSVESWVEMNWSKGVKS